MTTYTAPKLHIGFTGTQHGMSSPQAKWLTEFFISIRVGREIVLHHGACVGADDEAVAIAAGLGFGVIAHPPVNRNKISLPSLSLSDSEEAPLGYIERNHAIVDASEIVIGTPFESAEILRSGTWATIRYARRFQAGAAGAQSRSKTASVPDRTVILHVVKPNGDLL